MTGLVSFDHRQVFPFLGLSGQRADHRGGPILERKSPTHAGALAEVLPFLEERLGCRISELLAGHGVG